MKIRFLGQSAFELTDGDTNLLLDPFLTGNPVATVKAEELNPTHLALTHGHQDHYGDVLEIAKRTGASVQAITEIAGELAEEGLEAIDTNFGGKHDYPWGSIRIVPAFHTSTTPKGTVTPAGGLLIELGGKRVYHVGDTALFSDLKLVKRYGRIDVALIPIGGHYTMDRFDAVTAAEWIGADTVIPCHYDTFPPIEADAEAYKQDVQNAGFAEVQVLQAGGTFEV